MAQAGPARISNAEGGFAPNELDSYDNATYNLRLYMIPEADIISQNYDSDNKVVIAETGVTTQVLIDDLEIESYIAPSRRVRNQESVKFTFSLREYYGAGLLDKIFLASLDLGIKNYYKAPYFLELTFAGREANSSSPDIKAETLRWLWPITIRTIETEVDASGSLYEVEAYAYGNLAQTDDNGAIPKEINVTGKTVGEAVADLEEQMNNMASQEAVTNVTIPDSYAIEVDPEFAEMNLVDDNVTEAAGRNTPADTDDRETKDIPLDKNMNIGEAINRILSAAPEYQKVSKNTDTPSEQEVTDAEKTKKIHRIFSNAQIEAFDIGRGDYAKNFSFRVLPYETSTLQVSASEANADGRVVYNNLKGKSLIRKRYNYLYTGVNDQVLNFDLKFNLGWFVHMPSQAGLFTQYANVTEGQHVTNVYKEYQRIRTEITEARRRTANAPEPNRSDLSSQVQQEISAAEVTEEERAILERLFQAVINPRLPESENTNSGGAGSATASNQFVSEYEVTQEKLETAYRQYPMSYMENRRNDEDSEFSRSVESNRSAGRPYVNSLFQQAFSTSGDLVKVEIEAKGDPYWLESKDDGVEAQGSVDTRSAQNSIVFSVQTADLPSETTGIVEHTNSPFSGVYSVYRVDHVFSGGQFTQTLYGARDPKITFNDILEDLN